MLIRRLPHIALLQVIEQEVKVWKDLSHPNILQFVGACPIAEPPFMVSELKQNGDVLEYLRKEPHASRHKIVRHQYRFLLLSNAYAT